MAEVCPIGMVSRKPKHQQAIQQPYILYMESFTVGRKTKKKGSYLINISWNLKLLRKGHIDLILKEGKTYKKLN